MSRKKILLRKALGQSARGQGTTHQFRAPTVNGEHAERITPRRVAHGDGTYLQDVDNAFREAPHSRRGEGRVCSRPAGDRFQNRVRSLVKG